MKILAIEKKLPNGTAEQFETCLREQASYVWDLHQAHILSEIHFRADCPEAVLVLECNDLPEAEVILSSFPPVSAGLVSFDMIPLDPYSGMARLCDSVAAPLFVR